MALTLSLAQLRRLQVGDILVHLPSVKHYTVTRVRTTSSAPFITLLAWLDDDAHTSLSVDNQNHSKYRLEYCADSVNELRRLGVERAELLADDLYTEASVLPTAESGALLTAMLQSDWLQRQMVRPEAPQLAPPELLGAYFAYLVAQQLRWSCD